ncbi:hypothetical protein [Vibrio cincinnatiensis]|uniref:hypothetical protein n=1 Tax=Vibrio cincinnatiensis TaxID=675 RepID=UPI001EDFD43C|nr:hypothetical protein [Vibrio cincinnatiensis]MCG3734574.1 hypothetical protein [Vibrio cincinnatiensis]MCG3741681.1 hypothetical protein [Vibrio cincinnatiensis]MCG3745361.1 hypothetical protein [Vibrio cincinnatiensis]
MRKLANFELKAILEAIEHAEFTNNYDFFNLFEALNHNQGNWSATARQLALDSGNLHRLAKRLGIKS